MDVALHILDGMMDDLKPVLGIQTFVRFQRICQYSVNTSGQG